MSPTHVLVDLDGTISDSSVGIGRSLQHAFSECGYRPPTDHEVRRVIGPPFEIGLPLLGVHPDDVGRVAGVYRERYEDVGLFENEVYAGVPELLDELRRTTTLVVATAKPERSATRILEHFGLRDSFQAIVGATVEVGSSRRTKSAVITHAMRELDAPAGAATIMIGDRDHDVEGAHANGIPCVGVTWGFGDAEELTAAGADAIVDTPADVVAALLSTYRGAQR